MPIFRLEQSKYNTPSLSLPGLTYTEMELGKKLGEQLSLSDRSLTGTDKLSCQTQYNLSLNAEMKVNDHSQHVQMKCLPNDQPTRIRFNSLDLEGSILFLMLTVVLFGSLSLVHLFNSKETRRS